MLGLAVDERARKLYAVSTSALTSAGRTRPRNAVVVYDLRTGRRERTYPIPDALQLNLGRAPGANGIALAGNDRAYVTRFDADGKIAGAETVRPAQVVRIPWPASRS